MPRRRYRPEKCKVGGRRRSLLPEHDGCSEHRKAIAMSINVLRWMLSTAVGATAALGLASAAVAGPPPTPPLFELPGLPDPVDPGPDEEPEVNPDLDLPDLDLTAPPADPPEPPADCAPVDADAFGVTVIDNGDGTAFVQLGYYDTEDACDTDVRVVSNRTNADESVQEQYAEFATTVDELEAAAAGDGWVETDIGLDPCFSTVAVTVDGDLLHSELFGDGCEITMTKDFPDDPWPAAISLQHVPGWTDDHVFEVDDDDDVVWTGLPSGPYVVNEFDGAVAATTIAIDGGAPVAYDGGDVDVDVGQSVLFTNPEQGADPGPGADGDPGPGPGPDGPLPHTGTSATMALSAVAVLSGLSGLGLVAAARRRR